MAGDVVGQKFFEVQSAFGGVGAVAVQARGAELAAPGVVGALAGERGEQEDGHGGHQAHPPESTRIKTGEKGIHTASSRFAGGTQGPFSLESTWVVPEWASIRLNVWMVNVFAMAS